MRTSELFVAKKLKIFRKQEGFEAVRKRGGGANVSDVFHG